MRYATNKWNVKITIDGKDFIPFYYGFRTKKEALEEVARWMAKGISAEVIKH